MKKNKLDKKDFIFCCILAVSFIIFVLAMVRFKYYYGSTLDWESQHYAIPEYFRMLFYKTHDLLPDFAFNLGSGQNIYNFSYYGLLSPIIFLSYLLPFVRMIDYIVFSSIVIVIASAVLFYMWLRKNKVATHLESFLASFSLLFAACLSFHSHRHVMFINYMPFLILGLFGVDKKLTTGKGWLLTLSTFAMVMTSYYYSVGGIIVLVTYGIYKWIEITEKPNVKKFFIEGFKFLLPIIIGVIMSAIILLPTLHVILSSRGETLKTTTWKDFLPSININYVLYNTYGVGLTAILILAIVNLLFKKREKLFLGAVLTMVVVFPVFNYILNATMYIDSKALIPFLPLAVYAIYILIEDLSQRCFDYKKVYVVLIFLSVFVILKDNFVQFFFLDIAILSIFIFLYWKFGKKAFLVIPIVAVPLFSSLATSLNDEYVDYEKAQSLQKEFKDVLFSITDEEESIYRISNAKTILRDVNNLYGNIDYYTSTLYSSTYNIGYNKFYYDIMNNPIQNRNRVITSPTSNLLFLIFSGNKYLISNKANYFGYELFKKTDNDKIYKSDDVFPIIYARSETLDESEFERLEYPDQSIALLKGVVVDSASSIDYISAVQHFDFDSDQFSSEGLDISTQDGNYIIVAKDKATAYYKIPEEYQNKIIFVRFKMNESASCSDGDTWINIDGVNNKLTCKSWKYHNKNYVFDYILANKDRQEYKIEFAKGRYKISDIELYALDYDEIKDENKKLDEFVFDKSKTKGDYIFGNIDVSKDGYLVTSIPYDKGFKVWIDGKETEYTKVNKAFLGVKIEKGYHEVKIEYRAPLKDISVFISLFGIMLFIGCTFLERKRTTL